MPLRRRGVLEGPSTAFDTAPDALPRKVSEKRPRTSLAIDVEALPPEEQLRGMELAAWEFPCTPDEAARIAYRFLGHVSAIGVTAALVAVVLRASVQEQQGKAFWVAVVLGSIALLFAGPRLKDALLLAPELALEHRDQTLSGRNPLSKSPLGVQLFVPAVVLALLGFTDLNPLLGPYLPTGVTVEGPVPLALVTLLAFLIIGRQPTAFYREWLYTAPQLTPETRRRDPKKHPTRVRPSYLLLGAILGALIVPLPSSFPTRLNLIVGACVLAVLCPPWPRVWLFRDVLALYVVQGESSTGAPGVWRPRSTLEARLFRSVVLFGPLAATLAIGLSFFFPSETLEPYMRAFYSPEDFVDRRAVFAVEPGAWIAFPYAVSGVHPELLVSYFFALVSGTAILWLVPTALYAPALRALSRLEKRLELLDRYRVGADGKPLVDSSGEPFVRTTWDHYVDRLRGSTHEAEMPEDYTGSEGRTVREADHLFIGVEPSFRVPVLLHRSIVKDHVYVNGPTGSGKTSMGVLGLLLQLLRPHTGKTDTVPPPPLVFIDLKGSADLYRSVRAAVEQNVWTDEAGVERRQRFRFFSLKHGVDTDSFNPFRSFDPGAMSVAEFTELVLNSLALNHGEGYGRSYYTTTSRAALYRALSELRRSGREVSFAAIFEQLSPINPRTGKRAKVDRETFHLAAVVEGLTEFPQLVTVAPLEPGGEDRVIHMPRLLRDREVAYFALDATRTSITAREVANLAIYALVTAAREARHPQAYVFIDEVQNIASAGFEPILSMARDAGVGIVMASQSFAQLVGQDGHDLRPIVRTNTRARFTFGIVDISDAEELIRNSGEELITTTQTSRSETWKTIGGARTAGISYSTGSTESDVLAPRIGINDIRAVTNRPREFFFFAPAGAGYTQYKGLPISAASTWPLSQAEYLHYRSLDFPMREEPRRAPPPPAPDVHVEERLSALDATLEEARSRIDELDDMPPRPKPPPPRRPSGGGRRDTRPRKPPQS